VAVVAGPFSGDGSVETIPGQIRRPDVGVDCGRRDPNAMKAALPRMVAEVLSPTTRDFDALEKLEDYKQLGSLDYILVTEPNAPEVVVWSRGPERGWIKHFIDGIEHEIDLPGLGVTLRLAELYDGRQIEGGGEPDPRPRGR
jgi:Uma2 family endonuclease